jgi:hypothetical protein
VSHQDFVPEPRVRLRVVLGLLRVLAGRRGYAGVSWHGAGFTYRLLTTRTPEDDPEVAIDADPDALGGAEAAQQLRERLRTQP